ncbi:MAG: CoA pyrophosphatase, partial [Halobacteriales archaeon]|nr:CoA pyrophosphatase [Halobacteriales archaeon]
GGSREPSDDSLWTTAVREAGEEIGLLSDEPECIGQLDDILTVTDYSVTPYVARVPNREYVPDQREVAEIAVLPVSEFINPANYEVERRDHPNHGDIVVPFFHVEGYTVWGATARMVVNLLELTTDWRDPGREPHVLDTDPEL